MITWLVKRLLNNKYLYNLAKQTHHEVRHEFTQGVNTNIPEITPFELTQSHVQEKRLNLLVPALSEKHVFGGIATALRFYEKVSQHFPSCRIIITDEVSTSVKVGQYYSDWPVLDVGSSDVSGNSIVVAGNRIGKPLPVSAEDVFVTTAWWTTINAFTMMDWQHKSYMLEAPRKLIYFVQDFEPGFYPWSTRYALAESTYRKPDQTIPVFNTELLNDFFKKQGFTFGKSFFFDPKLNPELNRLQLELHEVKKKKQIIIYGRPSIERNLFSLIVQSLQRWSKDYDDSTDWKVYSAGEMHEPIQLDNGMVVESVGKLSLEQYANLLAESSVGVSLMLSPHPSYPPLEMAMFGVEVITNSYANKDLKGVVSNVTSLSSLEPGEISRAIGELCNKYNEEQPISCERNIFSTNEDEFTFIEELVEDISIKEL
ncbi:hypothetical protein P7F88_12845 [Vibrio hannami]|uniref:rhamnosyltransferase WsaF family glycosyltransferase n=1 Tax=Vibrio hannami TaxID=2717094 RepID=UPI00240EBCCA|nr:hypothetical protein [Vibrio hannami]MDG3086930.1 hypothetical protein [Vibrio hannami]